jgi:trk system potassium uptake protein
MHIVIAGSDDLAVTIAEALMSRHQVVLYGESRDQFPRLERLDVEVVEGELTVPSDLDALGLGRAGVFVACSDNDEANIVSCLQAQRKGARRTICLLTRPGYSHLRGGQDELAQSIGVDAIVRPANELAHEILRIIRVPGALDVEHLAAGRVRLLRHVVEQGSTLPEYTLRQTTLPPNVVLAMVRRGDEVFIPDGDTRLQVGDKVTAIGSPRGVDRLLFRYLRAQGHGDERHQAIVIGGGNVGFSIAMGLEAAGWRVKLVESDRERCEIIAPRLKGLVICGDGSDPDLLERERVGEYPVLVAVTSNDEKNLLVSLVARTLGVERIITRADRLANEKMFERVGIDVVRSARGAAIRRVVRSIIEAQDEVKAELEHGDIHIIEFELPADYPQLILADLKRPFFAIVGAVLRGRDVVFPTGRTQLRGGDRLLVLCSQADERAARDHFIRPQLLEPVTETEEVG